MDGVARRKLKKRPGLPEVSFSGLLALAQAPKAPPTTAPPPPPPLPRTHPTSTSAPCLPLLPFAAPPPELSFSGLLALDVAGLLVGDTAAGQRWPSKRGALPTQLAEVLESVEVTLRVGGCCGS